MRRRGSTGTSMQRHRLRPRRAHDSTRKPITDHFDRYPVTTGEQFSRGEWINDGRGIGRILHVEAEQVWIKDRWIAMEAIRWRYVRKPKR